MKEKTTSFRIDTAILKKVAALAAQSMRSVKAEVQIAINGHLALEEKAARKK